MTIRISRPAQQDLADVRAGTLRRWDHAQWTRYHARLVASMRRIGDDPPAGRERPDLSPGLGCRVHGSHLTFRRPASAGPPFAIRLLHGRRHPAALGLADSLAPR